ncbi:MAG: 4Fe-4S ferredoxin [Denitrovibrio sp.]|nr:MAG: 4Fe-4S ferredoxin [Denitrovibrio sp.]
MTNDLKSTAINHINELIENSPDNTLKAFNEKAWETAVVGFASGADPLFNIYKSLIGDFYWTPKDAIKLAYPNDTFNENNLSVIVWILPQTDTTLIDQRKETELPSSRWIHSRHYGEHFNMILREQLQSKFISLGIKAVAPAVREEFGYRQSTAYGYASNWSERHTAYAAGLGTFGLSDGFITEKGKAIRIGSVVIDAHITPDERIFENHTDNCLYYAKGTCGACIKRCPVGAISAEGHDKQICHDYIRGVTAPYAKEILGEMQTPCGLCQVKIPCEKQNPVKRI